MKDKGNAKPPSERIRDINSRIEAITDAVHQALLTHKRAGNPVAIWKDGRVQIIPPEDISEEAPTPRFV